MIQKILDARYINAFKVYIRFADGTEGELDLEDELYGEVFEPLKNVQFFKKVKVHPDFHTLCWPNGADIAPEFLYEKARKARRLWADKESPVACWV